MSTKIYFPLLRLSIILICSLLSFNVFAIHALPEFSAKYAVQKFGIKLAEAHYRLNYTETGYKLTQNTDLYGIAVYLSNYAVAAVSYVDEDGDNLLLRKHTYILSGSDEDKNEDIDILWRTPKNTLSGSITGVVRGQEISLATDSETWDLLSFQIPLMIEANKNVKEYPYNAILTGKIDQYTFELAGIKKITFGNKEYDALHMVCPDQNRNRQLHVWLVPALHNIPVIIENYRNDRVHFRAELESLSFNNEKPYIAQQIDDEDDF